MIMKLINKIIKSKIREEENKLLFLVIFEINIF